MKQPMLLTVTLLIGAIAAAPRPARALCLDENGTFLLDREAAPSEESFASASPASSDAEFKFQVDLNDLGNLGNLGNSPREESQAAPQETMPTSSDTATDAPLTMTDDAMTTNVSPYVVSQDAGTETTNADALGTLEVSEAPPVISREEYLDAIANDLNSCP